MIVHKSVYTAFYFAFAKYFVDHMLKDNEGRTASGRLCKLRSESIWKATRLENGVIDYVISPVLGNHGDWRIFYRTLYIYDTKPGENYRVLGEDYQLIDGYVFANALMTMGLVIPLEISKNLAAERFWEKEQGLIDNILGEILLNLFIKKWHPNLKYLLKDEFYDFSNEKIKVRHELPIILKSKPNQLAAVFPKAKVQVEALISGYLVFATCKCLIEECYDAWHPAIRQQEWQNNLANFSKLYDDYYWVDQIHTWDFTLNLGFKNSASAKIKLFFRTEIFSMGRESATQIFNESGQVYQIGVNGKKESEFNRTHAYQSEQWNNYMKTSTKYTYSLVEAELMYCDNRWYLYKIIPIQLEK